jgi:hypothetical protein
MAVNCCKAMTTNALVVGGKAGHYLVPTLYSKYTHTRGSCSSGNYELLANAPAMQLRQAA